MQLFSKRTILEIKKFFTRQYFVLFLMVAVGIKLCLFPYFIGFEPNGAIFLSSYLFSFLFAVLVFLPFIFIKKHKKPTSLALGVVLSVLLYLDLLYFRFFQSLPTFGLFDAIRQTGDIAPSIASLTKIFDIWIFFDVILISIFELAAYYFLKSSWQGRHKEEAVGKAEKVFLGILLAILITLTFSFTFLEAPRQRISDALSWSFETRYNTQYFGVMGSHMIDGYRYFEEKFVTVSEADRQEVETWVKTNLFQKETTTEVTGTATGKRVIMIQVESLGSLVIGKKYQGNEITPNLNKLMNSSNYFPNTRFVIGSGHTSDTDLVVNTSLYPLYDSAAFIRYGKDNYSGLPKVLAQAGYKPPLITPTIETFGIEVLLSDH